MHTLRAQLVGALAAQLRPADDAEAGTMDGGEPFFRHQCDVIRFGIPAGVHEFGADGPREGDGIHIREAEEHRGR